MPRAVNEEAPFHRYAAAIRAVPAAPAPARAAELLPIRDAAWSVLVEAGASALPTAGARPVASLDVPSFLREERRILRHTCVALRGLDARTERAYVGDSVGCGRARAAAGRAAAAWVTSPRQDADAVRCLPVVLDSGVGIPHQVYVGVHKHGAHAGDVCVLRLDDLPADAQRRRIRQQCIALGPEQMRDGAVVRRLSQLLASPQDGTDFAAAWTSLARLDGRPPPPCCTPRAVRAPAPGRYDCVIKNHNLGVAARLLHATSEDGRAPDAARADVIWRQLKAAERSLARTAAMPKCDRIVAAPATRGVPPCGEPSLLLALSAASAGATLALMVLRLHLPSVVAARRALAASRSREARSAATAAAAAREAAFVQWLARCTDPCELAALHAALAAALADELAGREVAERLLTEVMLRREEVLAQRALHAQLCGAMTALRLQRASHRQGLLLPQVWRQAGAALAACVAAAAAQQRHAVQCQLAELLRARLALQHAAAPRARAPSLDALLGHVRRSTPPAATTTYCGREPLLLAWDADVIRLDIGTRRLCCAPAIVGAGATGIVLLGIDLACPAEVLAVKLVFRGPSPGAGPDPATAGSTDPATPPDEDLAVADDETIAREAAISASFGGPLALRALGMGLWRPGTCEHARASAGLISMRMAARGRYAALVMPCARAGAGALAAACLRRAYGATLMGVALGLGIAPQLAAMHAAGIVHNDIKGDNVLLTDGSDGEPCVTLVDFGFAAPASGGGPTNMFTDPPPAAEAGDDDGLAPLGEAPDTAAADVWRLGMTVLQAAIADPDRPYALFDAAEPSAAESLPRARRHYAAFARAWQAPLRVPDGHVDVDAADQAHWQVGLQRIKAMAWPVNRLLYATLADTPQRRPTAALLAAARRAICLSPELASALRDMFAALAVGPAERRARAILACYVAAEDLGDSSEIDPMTPVCSPSTLAAAARTADCPLDHPAAFALLRALAERGEHTTLAQLASAAQLDLTRVEAGADLLEWAVRAQQPATAAYLLRAGVTSRLPEALCAAVLNDYPLGALRELCAVRPAAALDAATGDDCAAWLAASQGALGALRILLARPIQLDSAQQAQLRRLQSVSLPPEIAKRVEMLLRAPAGERPPLRPTPLPPRPSRPSRPNPGGIATCIDEMSRHMQRMQGEQLERLERLATVTAAGVGCVTAAARVEAALNAQRQIEQTIHAAGAAGTSHETPQTGAEALLGRAREALSFVAPRLAPEDAARSMRLEAHLLRSANEGVIPAVQSTPAALAAATDLPAAACRELAFLLDLLRGDDLTEVVAATLAIAGQLVANPASERPIPVEAGI